MRDHTATAWKARIVYWGLFLVFLFEFGEFVTLKVWDVIGPLFAQTP